MKLFSTACIKVLNNNTPITKSISCKLKLKLWISHHLKLTAQKKKAWNRYRQHVSPDNYGKYKILRNRCSLELHDAHF